MTVATAIEHDYLVPACEQLALPINDRTPLVPAPLERGRTGVLRDRAGVFMQAVVETLTGQRAAHQIAGWFTPEVFWSLRRALTSGRCLSVAPGTRGRTARPRLASLRVYMVDDHTAEVCARAVVGPRSHAIAVRLEHLTDHRGHTRWCCTALTWA